MPYGIRCYALISAAVSEVVFRESRPGTQEHYFFTRVTIAAPPAPQASDTLLCYLLLIFEHQKWLSDKASSQKVHYFAGTPKL